MKIERTISQQDKDLISYLRGFAILTIVFGHLGGYWVLKPFSSYLRASGSTFFFFLSGAVLYHSFRRSDSTLGFYLKRYVNLLLPYYLTCLVALSVYIYNHGTFPVFAADKFLSWITIQPQTEIMPFPLGQLWFLFTYVLLILLAPLYIHIYENNRRIFYMVLLAFLGFSVTQVTDLIETILLLKLYKYCFFSIFFMAGIFCFSGKEKNLRPVLITLLLASVAGLTVLGLYRMSMPDLTENFLRKRDVIAVMATMTLASSVVLLKEHVYRLISFPPFLPSVLSFFHRHTFSVYLLHTMCIYIAEKYFGLVDPQEKDATYGVVKLAVVLLLTSLLAVPFTWLSKRLIKVTLSTRCGAAAGTNCQAGTEKVLSPDCPRG